MDNNESFMNSQAQQAESRQQTSQIKRCAHCGAALDDDVLFCPECGEKPGNGPDPSGKCRKDPDGSHVGAERWRGYQQTCGEKES